jgi:SAM-dependent methyltransferase
VTVDPTPTADQLGAYYQTEYRYPGRGPLDDLIAQEADELFKRLNGIRYVHDYGCGDGYHMAEMKKRRPEIEVTGFDPNPESVEKARQRGLWGVWSAPYVNACADVVTLTHVIEHSASPIACLIHAAQSMNEDGYIYLRMPNAAFGLSMKEHGIGAHEFTAWRWVGVPWHLNYFTPMSIKAALKACGMYAVTVACSTFSEMAPDRAAYNAEHLMGEELVVLARNLA